MESHKRRKMLIEPRLQLRIGMLLLTTAGMAILLQAVLLVFMLQRTAVLLPSDGFILMSRLPSILGANVLLTFLLIAPLAIIVGVIATFRIVGSLYRMRVYLRQLAAGERPKAFQVRREDELKDICELLNQATASLREAPAPAVPAETAHKSAA